MTSPFPSLLRRSSFATYDPLITRIYASPSSSSGDWGFKYSTPLPKGPTYLKVANLDAGKAVTTDYNSGEAEARWMEAWGSGKVRWSRSSFFPAPPTTSSTSAGGAGLLGAGAGQTSGAAGEAEGQAAGAERRREPRGEMWMDDIESMTPLEFERYLDRVRASRAQWRAAKLDGLSSTARTRLANPEDQTLGYLNMAGHASPTDGANLQTSLAHSSLSDPSSTRLLSRPHRLGGLAYSNGPSSGASGDTRKSSPRFTHPVYTFPGRALDRASPEQKASQFTRRGPGHMTAWPMIVSAGGQIGVSNQSTRISEEKGRTHIMPVDYTRSKPEQGEARYSVSKATLSQPPTVVGLTHHNEVERWWAKDPFSRRVSGASRPRPMDTMDLRVEFDLAPSPDGPMADAGRGAWVSQGTPQTVLTAEDSLGAQGVGMAGGVFDDMDGKKAPGRSGRSGAHERWAASHASRNSKERKAIEQEVRADQIGRVQGLLSRLRNAPATPGGEQAAHGRAHRGPRGPRAGTGTGTGTPRI